MGAWSELRARDRLASNFLDTDPLTLTLHRPVWTISTAGGRVSAAADLVTAQKFHIYPFKRRLTQEYNFNPQSFGENKIEFIHYVLMFSRGADIEVDDYFNPANDVIPGTDRLQPGLYTVTFISARLWDRGQAGILYRG